MKFVYRYDRAYILLYVTRIMEFTDRIAYIIEVYVSVKSSFLENY